MRHNDGHDPEHGNRGAALAREMRGVMDLREDQLEALVAACREHTSGGIATDPTIGPCWDADRLDLVRLGVAPDPAFLSTDAARARIRGIHERGWFHGGPQRLEVGDQLLPRAATGTLKGAGRIGERLARDGTPGPWAGVVKLYRPDRVYITSNLLEACFYAAGTATRGYVYEVAPHGPIESDPENHVHKVSQLFSGYAHIASAATIVGVRQLEPGETVWLRSQLATMYLFPFNMVRQEWNLREEMPHIASGARKAPLCDDCDAPAVAFDFFPFMPEAECGVLACKAHRKPLAETLAEYKPREMRAAIAKRYASDKEQRQAWLRAFGLLDARLGRADERHWSATPNLYARDSFVAMRRQVLRHEGYEPSTEDSAAVAQAAEQRQLLALAASICGAPADEGALALTGPTSMTPKEA
jgi:hypothetical protein